LHSKPDIIYKLCIELVITNNMIIRVPDPILNLMITLNTSRQAGHKKLSSKLHFLV